VRGVWIKGGIDRWVVEDLRVVGGQYGWFHDPDTANGTSLPSMTEVVFINPRMEGQTINAWRLAFPGPFLNCTWIGLHIVHIAGHGFYADAWGQGLVFINPSDEQGAGYRHGNPPASVTTGSIIRGSHALTVANPSGFAVGGSITVQGAGTDRSGNLGLDLTTTIDAIDGNVLTLHETAAATVTDLMVTSAQYDTFHFGNDNGVSRQIAFVSGMLGGNWNRRYEINAKGVQGLAMIGMNAGLVYDPYRNVSAEGGSVVDLRQPPINHEDAFDRVSFPYYSSAKGFSQTVVPSPPGRDIVMALRTNLDKRDGIWGDFKIYKGRYYGLPGHNNTLFGVKAATGSEGDTYVLGGRVVDGKRGVLQTHVKNGAPVDGDLNNAADGAIIIDAAANKLCARVGGAWKCAVLN
jgi:hypothetical protein